MKILVHIVNLWAVKTDTVLIAALHQWYMGYGTEVNIWNQYIEQKLINGTYKRTEVKDRISY